MKIFKTTFLILFGLGCISFTSCGSGVNCANVGSELQQASSDLSMAQGTYLSDPSTENCEAFKTAYSKYIEEVRSFDECTDELGGQDLDQLIRDAEEGLDDLEC